ncbi:putative serine protease K12H4.7 [Diprion similis]|uniref:putative serine protease K12H4.7 n=1 Tax=Diprion similis TaxID=362088 RepID=UPI001EF9447C|nr:putative serine protease K12H4.7 [Diprion similis]XP_046734544.1 putative serine protease K12H4.7 [Diprion similis]XP_046734545.1 putative serine protease K12H4.7 [Diprion similis]
MLFIRLLVILVAGINAASALRSFARGRSKGGNLGTPVLSKYYELAEDEWFEQFLDHFNPTDARTWKQRYFTNSAYHKKGGPVFLMIGGEGTANAKWMAEGEWIEYAKQYGALCFQLEHRFYGKSHPTADLSVKNLIYLSSEQALADLAYFIEGMNLKHQIPAGTKWITFGGSYPGSLAAWSRAKYPHLVHGAMSASGPLLAQIDFQQYYVVVEDALRTHSQACINAVAAANKQVHIMLLHPLGQKGLAKKFKFCDPIDPGHTKNNDIANMYESLASNFAEVVQYNKDNRKSSKTANITIDTICNILVDEKRGTPVSRLAEVSNLLLKANKEKCFDYKYSKMISELRNVSWADEAAEGGRQWTYQTCTEFGFFQTSTARPLLFSETFPVDFFVQQCTDIFGPRYNIHLLQSAVERTNTIYGAFDLDVSNVVFVHGSIDPWHALGKIKSTNPQAPAIYINGTAHCANMYPKSDNDPPQLTEARKRVGQLIGQWLKN